MWLPQAAAAADAPAEGLAQTQLAQAEAARDFSIPPQPLGSALDRFSDQSGISFAYQGADIAGLRSPGVTGRIAPGAALQRLLAGTGVTYAFTGRTAVTLVRMPASESGAMVLPPVSVEGSATAEYARGPVAGYVATRSATGTKTDAPLIEIPQSIQVVTKDQIKDQGAQSVAQALRYTPGVRADGYGSSSPFDAYTQVRGFRSDLYLDGLRLPKGATDGLSSSVVEPWSLERVEVLKGPASGLYGQSGPGGLINMVSKRPTDRPRHEIDLQGGSYDRYQGAFDLSGPIDNRGRLLYRLTGLARDADTQVDHQTEQRLFIAPAFTWRPTDDTDFTLLTSYQRDQGVWSFFNYLPAEGSLRPFEGRRVPTSRFLGEPGFNALDREQYAIGYELSHRLNDRVELRQNLRFGGSDFYNRGIVTGRSYIDPDGTIDRGAIAIDSDDTGFAVDNQALFSLKTGPVTHDLVAGVDYRWERINYAFDSGSAAPLDVFRPVYGNSAATLDLSLENYRVDQHQLGIYFQDQAKFGQWIATVGARYDWTKSETHVRETSFAPAGFTEQKDDAFTGRVGLGYAFGNGIVPYASFTTSFQPEAGLDAVTGRAFKPSTGRQYEVGVKYQPAGTPLMLTLAAFDLTQENRLTRDDLFRQRQIGEVRVRGVELEVKAKLFDSLDLVAGYAYLDHEITKSADPAEVGRALFSTPNHQASLWLDHAFQAPMLRGLRFGAGIRYVGSTLDAANTIKVPDVTLVDARIRYELGALSPRLEGASVAVNATNLFDRKYVSQCDGDTMCTYGDRRSIVATLNYRW